MSVPNPVPLLDCRDIGVRFGGVVALSGVDFQLQPGEVHGLVGCNGAGKSTLMKVLAGVVPDYTGEIHIDGQPIHLGSPREALSHGIAMVYQELSGIEQLSVAENLFLGRQRANRWGLVDWREMNRQATASLAELDIQIDVRRRLGDFPLVIRQMVEIARGLHSGARRPQSPAPADAWRRHGLHQSFPGGCPRHLQSSYDFAGRPPNGNSRHQRIRPFDDHPSDGRRRGRYQ